MNAVSRQKSSETLRLLCLLLWLGWAAVFVAQRGQLYWAERWIQDDAYISFRYAKNLVRGEGLVFNPGARVEGYTNFSWVMLSAIPQAQGAEDPIGFMHALSLGLWAAYYAALFYLAWRVLGAWLAPFAPLCLSLNYSLNMWFFSGMETPLITFLFLMCIVAATEEPRRASFLSLGSLVGLTLMSRMDSAFFCAGALLAVLLQRSMSKSSPRPGLMALLAPLFAICLPYLAWRLAYYGSFFPNTYYAKLGYVAMYGRGVEYLRTLLEIYPHLALVCLAPLALLRPLRPARRRFAVTMLLSCAFGLLYVTRLGGDFMEWRFVTPLFGPIYLAALAGAASLVETLAARTLAEGRLRACSIWLAGMAAFASGSYLLYSNSELQAERARIRSMPGQQAIPSLAMYARAPYDWRELGRTLQRLFPPYLGYATSAAGMIPFFSEHRVVDLLGLTDRQLALAKRGKLESEGLEKQRVGHEFPERDVTVLRERGADFVLEWPGLQQVPFVRAYINPPGPEAESMSVRIDAENWVDIRIIKRTLPVWRQLRSDDRLELYDEREKAIQSVALESLSARVEDGSGRDGPGCIAISAELQVALPGPLTLTGIEAALESDDRYTLLLSDGERELYRSELEPEANTGRDGMANRRIALDRPIDGVTKLILRPHGRDWRYSICHLAVH